MEISTKPTTIKNRQIYCEWCYIYIISYVSPPHDEYDTTNMIDIDNALALAIKLGV